MMNARAPLELFDPGDHLLGLVRERPSNILLFEGVILITQAEIEEKHIDTRRQHFNFSSQECYSYLRRCS